jgi:16S rRNA (adenine1518-N6/adenine1519-N6)-dimethyltransferase
MNARKLLNQWNLRPDKQLGQNFLIDQTVLEKIVAAAELTPTDVVLEIGAGTGALTERLAQQAGRVVAVEVDQRLIPLLRSALADFDNITLIPGDILTLDPAALIGEASYPYKVVANLPYYITSVVLRRLLEATPKPQRMVVTVQREVAERIVARPGQMSLLAVSVQFYGHPELLFRIKPDSFYPAPEVESAVVRLVPRAAPPVPENEQAAFFRVVRAGFAQRRKQLRNALSAGLDPSSRNDITTRLREVGIDPQRRAQTLNLEEWVTITRVLSDLGNG